MTTGYARPHILSGSRELTIRVIRGCRCQCWYCHFFTDGHTHRPIVSLAAMLF